MLKNLIKITIVGLLLAATMTAFRIPIAAAADLGLIDAVALKANPAKWVILDARPKADWAAGHIPGAVSFSWDNYTRTDAGE